MSVNFKIIENSKKLIVGMYKYNDFKQHNGAFLPTRKHWGLPIVWQ